MRYRIVPFFISLTILTLLLFYSNFFKILELLSKSNLYLVSLGFFLWGINVVVRSFRWKFLLEKSGIHLSLKDAIHVYIPSLFLSNVSPGKIGDALRPALLKGMKSKSFSKSTPSVFVEKLLDVVALILFSLGGIFFFTEKASYFFAALIFYFIFFATGAWILASEKRTSFILKKIVNIFSWSKLVKKHKSKILGFSRELSSSFLKYKDIKTLLFGLLITFFVWLIDGLILFVSFKTIGISAGYLPCIFALSVSVLLGVISFLPGGLGVSELVVFVIFSTLYKLTAAQVMTAMVLSRLFDYWMYAIVGSVILSISKYKF